jgi:hypothetical protein
MAGFAAPIDPAAEAGRLADLFDGLSQELDDFRQSDRIPPGTSQADLDNLKAQAQTLEGFSQQFTSGAIGATLQAIQTDIAQIKAATSDARAQVAVLDDVSKAISIATSAVALGTAIAEGNPVAILTAAQAFAS